MAEQQDHVRSLIARMLKDANATATELARKAGLAPSTVNRFLNRDVKHVLSVPVLYALADAAGGRLILDYAMSSGERVGEKAQTKDELEILDRWRLLSKEHQHAVGDLISALAPSGRPASDAPNGQSGHSEGRTRR